MVGLGIWMILRRPVLATNSLLLPNELNAMPFAPTAGSISASVGGESRGSGPAHAFATTEPASSNGQAAFRHPVAVQIIPFLESDT